jgi:hypothetical protein
MPGLENPVGGFENPLGRLFGDILSRQPVLDVAAALLLTLEKRPVLIPATSQNFGTPKRDLGATARETSNFVLMNRDATFSSAFFPVHATDPCRVGRVLFAYIHRHSNYL